MHEHIIHAQKDPECLLRLGLQAPDSTLRRESISIPGSILKSYACEDDKMKELDICDMEV